jgi:hypothetical protein
MNRYQVKWIDGFHYVIDTKKKDFIVSSGYYCSKNAEIVCDKKNIGEDLSGFININL